MSNIEKTIKEMIEKGMTEEQILADKKIYELYSPEAAISNCKEMQNALHKFYVAYTELDSAWEGIKWIEREYAPDIEVGSPDSGEPYPFDRNFGEYNVEEWVDSVKAQLDEIISIINKEK